MKILIVSDAWGPSSTGLVEPGEDLSWLKKDKKGFANGVVKTLFYTRAELQQMGHEVKMVVPNSAWRFAIRLKKEKITLDLGAAKRVARSIRSFQPDSIHVSVEGPLGWFALVYCWWHGLSYTTAFHSKFESFFGERLSLGVPLLDPALRFGARSAGVAYLSLFHLFSKRIMVPTESIWNELARYPFFEKRLALWPRGVDTVEFQPYGKDFAPYVGLARPLWINTGRVSPEKNLPAFLDLDLPGTKIVIGEGTSLEKFRRDYAGKPVVFMGQMGGDDFARAIAAADLYVFPSETDTFGLAHLEGCACGLPVVAFSHAPGPKDVYRGNEALVAETKSFAFLDRDLGKACREAFEAVQRDPSGVSAAARAFAERHSWAVATELFEAYLFDVYRRPRKSKLATLSKAARACLPKRWR